jgi:hypothetical protein
MFSRVSNKNHWMVIAALGALLALALSASSVKAQDVQKLEQVQRGQKIEDPEKIYGKPGLSLSCAPSPNGSDYTCYKKPDGKPPSVFGRISHWLFRLVRDPIAVFTFMLLCVGVWQVGIAQRTAHRQLRAYIAVELTTITDGSDLTPPSDVGTVRGVVVVKNNGQTPAYDVVTWAGIDIARISEEKNLVAPAETGGIAVTAMGPGGTTSHNRSLLRPLTDHEISEVKTGKSSIYLFGRTSYRDVFGKRHSTKFRVRYSGNWPPVGGPAMNFCETGNEAD